MNNADSGRAMPHGERSASEADAKKDRESVGQTPANTPTNPVLASGEDSQGGRWGPNDLTDSTAAIGPAGAVRSRAERGPDGSAGLPCQNSNNSNKEPKRYRLERLAGSDGLFTSKGHKKAIWDQLDGDTLLRWGMPSGAEAKSAFHLRLNVASFVEHWKRNHCLFFTITDNDNLHPTQFARRWNSFLVRNGAWILSFIRVLEPQRRGSPHYHLLVAVGWDTLPDAFDWSAFDDCQKERRGNGTTALFRQLRARYKASAAPELVSLWRMLRTVLPRYGLGRAELLPLRKGKEAISEYVGKYLEAGLKLRKHSWKGCRRVEFDRRAKNAWLACSRVFAWHSPGAMAWRKRVGQLGAALGVGEMEGIRRNLGPKWAYRAREAITLGSEEEWQLLLQVLFTTIRTQPNHSALTLAKMPAIPPSIHEPRRHIRE